MSFDDTRTMYFDDPVNGPYVIDDDDHRQYINSAEYAQQLANYHAIPEKVTCNYNEFNEATGRYEKPCRQEIPYGGPEQNHICPQHVIACANLASLVKQSCDLVPYFSNPPEPDLAKYTDPQLYAIAKNAYHCAMNRATLTKNCFDDVADPGHRGAVDFNIRTHEMILTYLHHKNPVKKQRSRGRGGRGGGGRGRGGERGRGRGGKN